MEKTLGWEMHFIAKGWTNHDTEDFGDFTSDYKQSNYAGYCESSECSPRFECVEVTKNQSVIMCPKCESALHWMTEKSGRAATQRLREHLRYMAKKKAKSV